MALTLYAHPFSSCCQKVLTALYENGTPVTYRKLESAVPPRRSRCDSWTASSTTTCPRRSRNSCSTRCARQIVATRTATTRRGARSRPRTRGSTPRWRTASGRPGRSSARRLRGRTVPFLRGLDACNRREVRERARLSHAAARAAVVCARRGRGVSVPAVLSARRALSRLKLSAGARPRRRRTTAAPRFRAACVRHRRRATRRLRPRLP
jgi:hypothetical protein